MERHYSFGPQALGSEGSVGQQPQMSALSGFSFSFESELKKVFPNPLDIDWTRLLQWVLSLPSSTQFLRDEKQLIFEKVAQLFEETALPFAKLIIDESFLPVSEVTIRPDPKFGGIAGGKKYRQGMQLFKFASLGDISCLPRFHQTWDRA